MNYAKTIYGFKCTKIPQEGETIADCLNLDELVSRINKVNYYFQNPRKSEHEEEMWIVELYFKDDCIIILMYPPEISEERFRYFIKPLLNKMSH